MGLGEGGPGLGQAPATGIAALGVEMEGGGEEAGLRCHDPSIRRGSDRNPWRDPMAGRGDGRSHPPG